MRLLVNPVNPQDVVRLGDRMVPRQLAVELTLDPSLIEYRFLLEVVHQRPTCREIQIIAPEGSEIHNRDLAAIKIGNFIANAFAMTSHQEGETTLDRFVGLPGIARTFSKAAGSRYRKLSPELLERVAETYRQNVTGKPTEAVRLAFGISYPTAARWVAAARTAGFLPPTTPGKKGI
jgi:hypothetical protein